VFQSLTGRLKTAGRVESPRRNWVRFNPSQVG